MTAEENTPKLSRALRRRLDRTRATVNVEARSGDGATLFFCGTDDYDDAAEALAERVRAADIGTRIVVSMLVGDGTDRVTHPLFDVVLRRQRLSPTGALRRVWVNGPSMPQDGAP